MLSVMRRRHISALAAAGAIAAAGTGVAVATTRSDGAKQREDAVLSDAAKRLDVQPSELRDALAKAQDDQLATDVKAGRLTQAQADAIKRHRAQDGSVLGAPGPRHGGGGPGFRDHGGPGGPGRGPGDVMKAAADAVGLTPAKLFEALRGGKSLSDVAKAQGKSYADVKAAIMASAKQDLDRAVKDGKLTQAQADDALTHLTEHLDQGGFPGPPGGRDRAHDGPRP
jgi:hypothetical protein